MSVRIAPEMLVLAREWCGLTQTDLAAEMRITQPKVSKFESGLIRPSAEEAQRMAKILECPLTFLKQDDDILGPATSCLHHRKRQRLSAKDARRIYATINIMRMQLQRLLAGVRIDSADGFTPMDVDKFDGDVEEIARRVRIAWQLPRGPVKNLVRAAERAGAIVMPFSFGTRHLDAVSQRAPDMPPLIWTNSDMPADRSRLTLAHEIGHLVMHQAPTSDDPEGEAQRFAAEFLMPESDIRPELRAPATVQALAALKPRWKVSMYALAYRAQSLGIVSQHQAKRLYIRMGKLGWKKGEPIPLEPEQPTVLKNVLDFHQSDHGRSLAELAEMSNALVKHFKRHFMRDQPHLRLAK